jgi:hypothetical protein
MMDWSEIGQMIEQFRLNLRWSAMDGAWEASDGSSIAVDATALGAINKLCEMRGYRP